MLHALKLTITVIVKSFETGVMLQKLKLFLRKSNYRFAITMILYTITPGRTP